MIRAAVIFLALALASHAAVLDVPRFLGAIRAVEEWDGRDGRHGERGPWQITAGVWSMHMPGIPFAEARHEGPARACALKHVAYLRARLRAGNVDDNTYNLAMAWNAGHGAVLRSRVPDVSYFYAARVEALYLGAKGQKTLNSPAETSRRWSVGVGFIVAGALSTAAPTSGGGINQGRVAHGLSRRVVALNAFVRRQTLPPAGFPVSALSGAPLTVTTTRTRPDAPAAKPHGARPLYFGSFPKMESAEFLGANGQKTLNRPAETSRRWMVGRNESMRPILEAPGPQRERTDKFTPLP